MYYVIVMLIMIVILLAYLLWGSTNSISKKDQDTKNFHKSCSSGFLNLPIMAFIVDITGEIKWYSEQCSKVLADGLYVSGNIDQYIPELGVCFKRSDDFSKDSRWQVNIRDCVYNVVVSKISSTNANYEVLICLFDITDRYKLECKVEDISSVMGFIQVDNYSEIIDGLPEEDKVRVVLELDKIMYEWSISIEAYLKKYSDNRFLIIMDQSGLRDCQANSFEILDQVRQIDIGASMPLTLSIGLGKSQDGISDINRLANVAFEMAISRGGDQSVVKLPDDTIYYSGKATTVSKKTKVRARGVADALKKHFSAADKIIIMGHIYSDLDSAASAIGLAQLALTINKNVIVSLDHPAGIEKLLEILANECNTKFKILTSSKDIMNEVTDNTLLVICDTNKPALVAVPSLLDKVSNIIVIDHHIRSEELIKDIVLSYIEPGSSSTCELVSEIIQYFSGDIKWDPIIVSGLLAGLTLDTKNFTARTGARTFEAAGYLRRLGADQVLVRRLLQDDYDTVNYRSQVIKSAKEVYPNIAVGVFTEMIPQRMIVAAQAADVMLDNGLVASFVLYYLDNSIKVSGRSDGSINVAAILEKLGGGGHFNMAGLQLFDMTMDDAYDLLVKTIGEYINPVDSKISKIEED